MVKITRLLLFVILIAGLFFQADFVRAESDNCYWQLISEIPRAFTASTAPEASSSVSGTMVNTSWEGLTTTHSWSHPGIKLVPGDKVSIIVNTSWKISSGDALNSTSGLKTSFTFGAQSVSAGRDSIHFNAEKSGSVSNSSTFTVPSGSEDATFSIYGFADAAVAGGRVDYKYNYVCATPTATMTPSKTIIPTRTITSTKCPADTKEKKLAYIMQLYTARIPKGKSKTGKENNIYDFFQVSGYAEFTCGGYQSKVLDFLNKLKFSKDPCEKQLFDDWDYGPIQAWFGYHQAVVIYPKGTDWQSTGIVLDPWPDQTPKTYSANDWAIMFSSDSFSSAATLSEQVLGATFIGIDASDVYRDGQAYPIVGGNYKDASNEDINIRFSEEEFKFIHSLSPEKRVAFNKLPKPEQKRWLQVVMQTGEKLQKTIAHCPLNLFVKDADGKRSGILGAEILTEIPDVQFMVLKLTDGTNYTEITYPENTDYTLVLESTDDGQAHVFQGHTLLLGESKPPLQQYSIPAKKGETYQIATDGLGAPMKWEGGLLAPEAVTEISAEFLETLPKLFSPGMQLTEDFQNENDNTAESGLLNWRPPLWLAILILLIGIFLFTIVVILLVIYIRKRKTQHTLNKETVDKKNISHAFWVLLIISTMSISCLVSGLGILGLFYNVKNSGMIS